MDSKGELQFDCISPVRLALNVDGLEKTNFVARDIFLTVAQAIELRGEQAVESSQSANNLSLYTRRIKYIYIS